MFTRITNKINGDNCNILSMGTKITYKSLSRNSKEDNSWVKKSLEKEEKIAYSEKELKKLLKDPDNHFIQLSRFDIYAINKLHYKKHHFLLLEGNPVTYYFSLAYDILPQVDEARLLLTDSLTLSESKYGWKRSVAFSYIFKIGAMGIIFSFLALEAFINQCLPDFAKIEFNGKLVTKNTIQRFLTFDDKLRKIIPKVSNKDFISEHPKKMEVLSQLKKMRDTLSHLKENRNDGIAAYDSVYNEILNVDLKRIVNTVKFYINYHHPKTIQNYARTRSKKARVLYKESGEDAAGKFVKYYYGEYL